MHKDKKGSIPTVFGITVVLGIIGSGSLFISQGVGRTDKRTELIATARQVAQTAVEETLVKITNGKVTFNEKERRTFPAYATRAMYGNLDLKLTDVEVMGRLVEEPADKPSMTKFKDLITALPGFAPNHDPQWRSKIVDPQFKAIVDAQPQAAAGTKYHEEHKNDTNGDGGKIKKAFALLTPLSGTNTVAHAAGELAGFQTQWQVAMEAVAEQEAARIAGCGGNPAYGIAAEMAAIANGGAAKADGEAEEQLRKPAQNAGVYQLRTFMATVQAEAEVRQGGMKAKEPVRAERLVYLVKLEQLRKTIRQNLMAYLHFHYNFSMADFQALGWADAAGESKPEILSTLNEEYPETTGTRVGPFQIATCTAKQQVR